jgi:hypothetical protein
MKVCWSIVRDLTKQHGKLVREDLIQDLIDMGVPSEIANELLYRDRLEFMGNIEGAETQIVLDLIFPSSPLV